MWGCSRAQEAGKVQSPKIAPREGKKFRLFPGILLRLSTRRRTLQQQQPKSPEIAELAVPKLQLAVLKRMTEALCLSIREKQWYQHPGDPQGEGSLCHQK